TTEDDRVVCSLWALGRSIEDRLVLDRSGEVLKAPAPISDAAPPSPLPPVWGPALADLLPRERAPGRAGWIRGAMANLSMGWGGTAGDVLRVDGAAVRLSRRLRDIALAWIRDAPAGTERAERAVHFVLEVARLLGPTVRLLAQVRLEESSEDEQQCALREDAV